MTNCATLFFCEEKMNNVEVSSFLLIEDSADSEDDYGFFSLGPSSIGINGDNEDDAESCSCDTTINGDNQGFVEFCGIKNEFAALEDEAETRTDEAVVNELEDRLFWETCMAVGYPGVPNIF